MNAFELPDPPVTREITINGKAASYTFRQLGSSELESLFDLSDEDGKVAREKSKGLRFRVIAAMVSRQDGTPITAEQAGAMRNDVVKALYDTAMEVSGFGEPTEPEAPSE